MRSDTTTSIAPIGQISSICGRSNRAAGCAGGLGAASRGRPMRSPNELRRRRLRTGHLPRRWRYRPGTSPEIPGFPRRRRSPPWKSPGAKTNRVSCSGRIAFSTS
jgi:hypothetical protein